MAMFYVETGLGATLIDARTAESAARKALIEVGTYSGVNSVRKATAADLAWIRAMRGTEPPEEP
jgi:hypothetical protein